jgi:hypothetical protein
MEAEEYAQKTLMALRRYKNELDEMERAIMATVPKRTAISNPKGIFKELAEAARECAGTLEFYGENGPLPDEVRVAMLEVQEAIDDCASALVLAIGVLDRSE